ncbi:MAG: carboxypeptidase regulatory-like domain-containing protein [Gemmatimonadales bacterium]
MAPVLVGVARLLLLMQATQASVVGTVRDGETGLPLVGAVVSLPDLDRTATTSGTGRYALAEVPAGPHHISIRFIGYEERTLHALVPRSGQLEIDVSLQPRPYRLAPIVVRTPVPVRGLDVHDGTVYPDRVATMAAVRNHPLVAEPDAFLGVAGGEVVVRPESPGGVHIRGGAADQTGYQLDGIPVLSPYHTAGVFSAWNPDALAELHLHSTVPTPELPAALSGTITGTTRAPGERVRSRGGMSNTQARLTFDGPIGKGGAGFLLSARRGFPGVIAPDGEASYLRGTTGDLLAKVEAPLLGGRMRLLGYDNGNEINTAATVAAADTGYASVPRNTFEWRSRSVGGEWKRPVGRLALRLRAWNASADAGSAWAADSSSMHLASERRDLGMAAAMEHPSAGATVVAGLRVERSWTAYDVGADAEGGTSSQLDGTTWIATPFLQYARVLGASTLELGASVPLSGGRHYPAPQARLTVRTSDQLALVGSYARTHQFAQSLRNAESVVGTIFPADLWVGAGSPGVPVARSDLGILAANWQPLPGVRLGVQGYLRSFEGLVLVAPRESGPFATDDFIVGNGRSAGAALEAGLSTARWGVLVSYGYQDLHLDAGEAEFVPEHGAAHVFDAGVIYFPGATASIRVGVSGMVGRRGTPVTGGLEWESCNLLDQGCEFGGSPTQDREHLGSVELPAYTRLDIGVRKHWHLHLGGRDAVLGMFGTVTNVLGRYNTLTQSRNPTTGRLDPVQMRPLAPLAIGFDWQF